ncbi:MAG: SDR family oxidoreductase [Saprospirales bacterium]|nr:SDR family oxidoreductase [Saprospirales bacterium]MBK8489599.1 SDR family oxidoreductase [Saprospirales bacterium]
MNGKTICITGANSGIGFHTAQELARAGARVILGVRNREKGENAAVRIRTEIPGAQVDVFPLDLSSRKSIESFAGRVREATSSLDVLVNNAGQMSSRFETTEDGFELQVGVNYLGHFLLTRLLLDRLKQAPEGRVIHLSSSAHYGGKIDFERFRADKGRYKGMPAYAQSKLANVLFASELARRYPDIRSYSLHPGVVGSNIVRPDKLGWLFTIGWTLFKPFTFSPKRGAKTSLFLATATPAPEPNGQYFDEHQHPMKPSRLARDTQVARELWETSERLWREAGATI